MSLGVGISTLSDARKALAARWSELGRTWNDEAARRFERDFIRTMDDDLRRAIDTMTQAQRAADRARQECT